MKKTRTKIEEYKPPHKHSDILTTTAGVAKALCNPANSSTRIIIFRSEMGRVDIDPVMTLSVRLALIRVRQTRSPGDVERREAWR